MQVFYGNCNNFRCHTSINLMSSFSSATTISHRYKRLPGQFSFVGVLLVDSMRMESLDFPPDTTMTLMNYLLLRCFYCLCAHLGGSMIEGFSQAHISGCYERLLDAKSKINNLRTIATWVSILENKSSQRHVEWEQQLRCWQQLTTHINGSEVLETSWHPSWSMVSVDGCNVAALWP